MGLKQPTLHHCYRLSSPVANHLQENQSLQRLSVPISGVSFEGLGGCIIIACIPKSL